jgi:hypothetical protein
MTGADYWIEIPEYVVGETWHADELRMAGLELLYVGPRGSVSAFLKVRDPAAPPELTHKTVQLTVDLVVVDPNASPPTYAYKIVERKDMNVG